jgi:hypothetical protein
MKRITITKVKKLLQDINADDSTAELILNNVVLYNGLVEEYNSGEKVNQYLLYQLNNQIIKQIEGVKKLNQKLNEVDEDDDAFSAMEKAVKKQKAVNPIGFQNKKDIETR